VLGLIAHSAVQLADSALFGLTVCLFVIPKSFLQRERYQQTEQ
jgi:hypothetical protein